MENNFAAFVFLHVFKVHLLSNICTHLFRTEAKCCCDDGSMNAPYITDAIFLVRLMALMEWLCVCVWRALANGIPSTLHTHTHKYQTSIEIRNVRRAGFLPATYVQICPMQLYGICWKPNTKTKVEFPS